jgi:hypothetical protein
MLGPRIHCVYVKHAVSPHHPDFPQTDEFLIRLKGRDAEKPQLEKNAAIRIAGLHVLNFEQDIRTVILANLGRAASYQVLDGLARPSSSLIVRPICMLMLCWRSSRR